MPKSMDIIICTCTNICIYSYFIYIYKKQLKKYVAVYDTITLDCIYSAQNKIEQ